MEGKRRRIRSGLAVCIGVICMFATSLTCLGSFFSSLVRESAFGDMMDEWATNARTNTTEETMLRFRDEVVVPLVRREMPNPFAAGGAEAAKTWTKEADRVYEVGLRNVCDGYESLANLDHRNCRKAGELVERGCDEPFIMALSLFDPKHEWWFRGNKVLLERLSAVERKLNGQPGRGFLRLVVAYFRCKLGAGKWEDVYSAFDSWVQERKFGKDEEPPLLHLSRTFCIPHGKYFQRRPEFKWLCDLASVRPTIDNVVRQTGDGLPRAIGSAGWRKLQAGGHTCESLLDDAESIRPGSLDALTARFYAMCLSRTGRAVDKDRLFMDISKRRLDDAGTLGLFVFRRLLPRWGGSHGMMRRFARACYSTGRHDTILPYLYAEVQCICLRDSVEDPFEYFGRNHPEMAEKCIDACMRQATNAFACARTRLRAPFVGAAVAYFARRYEDAAKFSPHIPVFPPGVLDELFSDKEEIRYAVDAFASKHSEICIRLQRMCDDGKWREVLAEIDGFPKNVYDEFEVKHFLHTQALKARMKTDFVDGKDVKGDVPPYFPGWWNPGWWRCGNQTWQTHRGFTWKDHLTWRAPLPKSHELEFTLQPKPKTKGCHVLVVSRFVYEETHYRPLNGIPFVTLIWEKDRTGVVVNNDYYALLKVDPSCAIWEKADRDCRRIRIVVDGDGGLHVFAGNSARPVLSTKAFCDTIRRSPKTCYARFRGDNVRISDIAVRKVRP